MSPALISSWENTENHTVPPVHRLDSYATFFASERSVESTPYRVLAISDLAEDERVRRNELLTELVELTDPTPDDEPSGAPSPFDGTLWQFPQGEDITIVSSELPHKHRVQVPYMDPHMPDFIESYKYADLDALIELFGHLRAANPTARVHIRVGSEMGPDEYANHLVLLGGVDWNQVTAILLPEIELVVRQLQRPEESNPGAFEVGEGEQREVLSPVLRRSGEHDVLREDVAHFYRSTNPFNVKRTITICNGMYQRGTLGVVRALTDEEFRKRNDHYIHTRFAGADTFSIISRVRVVNGVVITPDWTMAADRLHEWPAERSDAR